jgi:hypothetical protein
MLYAASDDATNVLQNMVNWGSNPEPQRSLISMLTRLPTTPITDIHIKSGVERYKKWLLD